MDGAKDLEVTTCSLYLRSHMEQSGELISELEVDSTQDQGQVRQYLPVSPSGSFLSVG
jgi:hypothetical protein